MTTHPVMASSSEMTSVGMASPRMASSGMPSTPFLPILNNPIQFHSSRNPGACTLKPDQCVLKNSYWVFWYEADLVYCLPVVYLFVSAITVFTVGRFASDFTPATMMTQRKSWRCCVSAVRFLSYKSWRIGSWYSQSLGVLLLAAIGVVFFSALTLGPQPYYWPTDARYGNSPPIATRTGWMALACMPFILAFGAKANMVTALTGISTERLNTWHSWVSWAMLVLALIHTFPFIVYHRDKGDLTAAFRTGGVWLTGVVAIIAQAWLTFMSVSWIRNKWYEFFKSTHYFFAAVFLVFFFLHCSFRLTSWDYFIAAGVIYLSSLFYALARTLKHGIGRAAILRVVSPQSLRITVPTKSKWKPGQHAYLRFLTGGLHSVTAHPFTICSAPLKGTQHNEMVFYLKPLGGLTNRLASMAQKQEDVSLRVLLEGPYGGLPGRWYKGFDRTILIAGGSGSSFTFPLIEDWLSRRDSNSTSELKVVLATKDVEMRIWYTEELRRVTERQRGSGATEFPGVSILLYETYDTAVGIPVSRTTSSGSDEEKGKEEPRVQSSADSTTSLFGIKVFRGRPDTGATVREASLQQSVGTVGIAVCGPAGMVYDVASEAAAQQQRILSGHAGASEVWFHLESFS
ncbi:Flavoprotein transmembrane component [Metarhizium guizhouense ARSEF 977]|uniref:ferric-chelate reductase (NADPH) n=1 Tax=Metarhizium guizhouense (strain ARSEF 977) TaxID=1276136 RepID=A0A0B4I5E6_METGA|nr:Flavoprotein transmembrane component [Metarhizium guizhouense ARSEF 977]